MKSEMKREMETREKFKANIMKSYFYRFLRSFMLLSGVLVPFFTVWGGISFFQIMILQAIFTTCVFLFEVPTGVVADKLGRKTSLFLAGIIGSIGALIYGSHPSFWVFALGEMTWALGTTLVSGANQAMLYDSLREIKQEKKSKKVFGTFDSIGLGAILVSAPIGSLVAKFIGLRFVMLLMIVPFLLSSVFALSMKEPEIGRKSFKKKNYGKILKSGAKYLKKHKVLRILMLDYILIGILSFFIIWAYQLKLQNIGFDVAYFGFVHAGLTLFQIIVINGVRHLEKFFGGKKRFILCSALIAGLFYIVIGLTSNLYIVIPGFILIAGFGLGRKPVLQSYLNKYIRSGNRATVLSLIAMAYAIGMAVVDLVLGYFGEINLNYTFIAAGVLIVIFAFVSRVQEEHLKD
jgi:MFS family permease